jgi:hypothetical protein
MEKERKRISALGHKEKDSWGVVESMSAWPEDAAAGRDLMKNDGSGDLGPPLQSFIVSRDPSRIGFSPLGCAGARKQPIEKMNFSDLSRDGRAFHRHENAGSLYECRSTMHAGIGANRQVLLESKNGPYTHSGIGFVALR